MSVPDNSPPEKGKARIFSFQSRWHAFRGAAFGLQQPTLWGKLAIHWTDDAMLAVVEEGMASLLAEPFPLLPADMDPHEKYVWRIVWWLAASQRQAGIPLSESCWIHPLPLTDNGERNFEIGIPYLSQRAAVITRNWLDSVLHGMVQNDSNTPSQKPEPELFDKLQAALKPYSLNGINQVGIINAANRLDIPVMRMTNRVLFLGSGCYGRWMDSTLTDRTSPIGANIARDKIATANLLRSAGLPGATQIVARSSTDAATAAAKLGYPVVVKPSDKDKGKGVFADLRNDKSVVQAYDNARLESANIIVEKFFPGATHRLTVFQGKVVRVTKRIAGGVVGDGHSSVSRLIELWQQDEDNLRRTRRIGKVLLALDAEARDMLDQHGVDENHIPETGEYIRLRRRDNINTGGTNEYQELDQVHGDNLRLAIDAAQILRLDFAGIDLIIDDISRSWLSTGALICEINGQPQMGTRNNEKVYETVLQELMGAEVRVPARLIVLPDTFNNSALIESLTKDETFNGISDKSGIWIDGIKLTSDFKDSFAAVIALLIRPEVKAAISLMSETEVVRLGLPQHRWSEINLDYLGEPNAGDESLRRRLLVLLAGHAPPYSAFRQADSSQVRAI